jgi:TatD DNase family protein
VIDAHCHLDSDRLGVLPEVALEEAHAAGVEALVMAGVEPAGWAAQRALAARFPEVHPVFGIHPQLVAELSAPALDEMLGALERELSRHRPVALGETGLDRLSPATKAAIDLQLAAFREQLRLARRFELPVVLHLLRADEAALKVLSEEPLPAAGGVVHSFSGSAELARKLVGLGLHLSFSGPLTFPQSRRLREAAAAVPLERLLVETDAPDQTPEPHRGEKNRPALLPYVVRALAAVRGLSFEEVARLTADNTRRLFGLASPG